LFRRNDEEKTNCTEKKGLKVGRKRWDAGAGQSKNYRHGDSGVERKKADGMGKNLNIGGGYRSIRLSRGGISNAVSGEERNIKGTGRNLFRERSQKNHWLRG